MGFGIAFVSCPIRVPFPPARMIPVTLENFNKEKEKNRAEKIKVRFYTLNVKKMKNNACVLSVFCNFSHIKCTVRFLFYAACYA